MTFHVQDRRDYTVSSVTPPPPAPGRVVIEEASHPDSVEVNKEFSWHVVGHVRDRAVGNPGVGYWYRDGPADRISIVRRDGSTVDLSRGRATIIFRKGDYSPCHREDSRALIRGAIFPSAGTFSISLISGFVDAAQAAAGKMVYRNIYEIEAGIEEITPLKVADLIKTLPLIALPLIALLVKK